MGSATGVRYLGIKYLLEVERELHGLLFASVIGGHWYKWNTFEVS